MPCQTFTGSRSEGLNCRGSMWAKRASMENDRMVIAIPIT